MRKILASLLPCAWLTGCAYFPDFETSPAYHMPISEVVNQIKCDIYDFLLKHEQEERPNFSLDKTGYATVELALTTTAYGDVKFSKIDTLRLGAQGFLAIGSSSQPFPSLGTKALAQSVAKVQVNIAQDSDKLRDSCGYGSVRQSGPHSDQVLVNQIRVKEWLIKSFERAQRIRQSGPVCRSVAVKGVKSTTCGVSLETATLTTKFQLIVDASAGVLDLAKLIPVIATPTLQLNADYNHQITIIFHGNNAVAEGATAGLLADEEGAPVDTSTALILRQLRAIRDATVLSAPQR